MKPHTVTCSLVSPVIESESWTLYLCEESCDPAPFLTDSYLGSYAASYVNVLLKQNKLTKDNVGNVVVAVEAAGKEYHVEVEVEVVWSLSVGSNRKITSVWPNGKAP